MIYKNGQEISGVYFKPDINEQSIQNPGAIDVAAVYRGYRLVWSKFNDLLSCYSNGYWIDQYPWTDNTYWVD